MNWTPMGKITFYDDNPEENPNAQAFEEEVWMAYFELENGQEVVAVHTGDPEKYYVTDFISFQDAYDDMVS